MLKRLSLPDFFLLTPYFYVVQHIIYIYLIMKCNLLDNSSLLNLLCSFYGIVFLLKSVRAFGNKKSIPTECSDSVRML